MRYSALMVAFLLLVGCGHDKEPEHANLASPLPRPVVRVTASPRPEPQAQPSFRVRTVFPGSSNVTFDVTVNGRPGGSFNTSAQNDITPLVSSGDNTLEVAWKADPEMTMGLSAEFYFEQRRSPEDDWNTLVSRQVNKDTEAGRLTTSFVSGEVGLTEPPVNLEQPAKELSDRFTVKVEQNKLLPADFTLTLNGQPVGSFAADSDQDVTRFIRSGENRGTLVYEAKGHILPTGAETRFVLGVERDGKWSTVMAQSVGKGDP
ncbi:MAG: hypothetical protein KC910_31810, partial [Candidatus Eremiobacteraeota bacterium]|nr:hypothetical protein [Candidatus Eremiobacteraeota bacterium]